MTANEQERQDATLAAHNVEGVEPSANYAPEVEVPTITCVGCGQPREVAVSPTMAQIHSVRVRRGDILRGTLFCPYCEHWTAFELTGNHVTFIQSKSIYGSLAKSVPSEVTGVFHEAESCFRAGNPNGSAAMSRAALFPPPAAPPKNASRPLRARKACC